MGFLHTHALKKLNIPLLHALQPVCQKLNSSPMLKRSSITILAESWRSSRINHLPSNSSNTSTSPDPDHLYRT